MQIQRRALAHSGLILKDIGFQKSNIFQVIALRCPRETILYIYRASMNCNRRSNSRRYLGRPEQTKWTYQLLPRRSHCCGPINERAQIPMYVTVLHELLILRRILLLGNGVSYAEGQGNISKYTLRCRQFQQPLFDLGGILFFRC